jgi:hypothetical protein
MNGAKRGIPGDHPMSHPPVERHEPLKGEVVYHPQTIHVKTPAEFLDLVSYLMDRCFVLPGTNVRFGLNAVFLVLPVLGDIIPALVSLGILTVGLSSYRVPRIVAARMVLNSLLDISLGWVPILGDLFDVYFKADTRNVRLLQEYMGTGPAPPRSTWRHWLFVFGVIGAVILVLVLLVLGVGALIQWMVHHARSSG